jgi:type II secretory pathway pseudopilin PulG
MVATVLCVPIGKERSMSNRRRIERLLKRRLRSAGRQYAEARRAYDEAKSTALRGLPIDENGEARIVCRRYAERRAIRVDETGRPECYEPDHPDCEGCVEDIREQRIETW